MANDDSKLEQIYSEAVYAVISNNEEIRFKVAENSEEINTLLDKFRASTFAFLTAYNPLSKKLSKEENRIRQNELIKILQAENFRFLEGYGTNEAETWEREDSLFIFDISERKAVKIARRFEQHAILFGMKNKAVELIWCSRKV